jgi:hypothetical protein
MEKELKITVENKLIIEKRDLNVYHHFTRSAHMISYNSSITVQFRSVIEDDYLYISIVGGPGPLEGKCLINLPSWVDFEFTTRDSITVVHAGDRVFLKIPPGPPSWQLKMTRSVTTIIKEPGDLVIIGDDLLECR